MIHDRALSAEEIRRRVLPSVTAKCGTPSLDGKLNDRCWKNAEPITRFLAAGSAVPAGAAGTTAYLTYDDEAVYAAFRCGLPAGAEAGAEEYVEVYLSPVPAQGSVYRFTVSADGTLRTSGTDSSGAEQGAAAAVGSDGNAWIAEVRIPYRALKLPLGAGERWGINLMRGNQQTGPTWIWSSAVVPDAPDRFGTMICRKPVDLRPFMKRTVSERLGHIRQQMGGLPAPDVRKLQGELAELEKLQDMDVLSSRLDALEGKVLQLLTKNAVVKGGRLEVRIGHSLQKISSDQKPFGNVPERQVRISVARNEAESCPVIVSASAGFRSRTEKRFFFPESVMAPGRVCENPGSSFGLSGCSSRFMGGSVAAPGKIQYRRKITPAALVHNSGSGKCHSRRLSRTCQTYRRQRQGGITGLDSSQTFCCPPDSEQCFRQLFWCFDTLLQTRNAFR